MNNTYHVTYYYLATGMDGRPQTKDYGHVYANSVDEAKTTAMKSNGEDTNCTFTRSCLTAKLVSGTSTMTEASLDLTEADEVLTPIELPDVFDILLRRKEARSERASILRRISEHEEDLATLEEELEQLDAELDDTVSQYL